MEDGRLIGGLLMEVQLYTEWDDNHVVSIKHGLRTADHGLRTGYKIEILGGGSLNQEPDKNAVFYTHFRHGLGL